MLHVSDVHKSFDHPSGAVKVLKGLSLDLESGSTLSVVGPSGSGKSSLLAILAGLDMPDFGKVVVDGEALNGMNETELTAFRRRKIAIVFQKFHLITSLTAEENVSLPLEILGHESPRKNAREALERVGLGHRLSHFPRELSGGEAQRVAIARALVTEPSVLLADEPSGNLDTQTGDQVMQLLFDLVASKGTSLVLVTHNEHLAKRCDRVLTLRDGVLQA